jgi:cytochrome P450
MAQELAAATGCPHGKGFNPLDPATAADVYPRIGALRDATPIFEMPEYGMWCVTRHADIVEIMRNPSLFSNAPYAAVAPMPEKIRARVGDDYIVPVNSDQLLTTDPPRHTRLRKVFQPSLTPRALSRHEPAVCQMIDALIDGFIRDGETEFVSSFASPLPLRVIGLVLGLPPDRREEFRGYVQAVMRAQLSGEIPADELEQCWETILGFDDYFRDFLADRREHVGDDVASVALHAPVDPDDDEIGDRTLRSTIIGMAIAGADTTTILMTHALHLLLAEPDRWRALQDDPSGIPAVVEETLRLNGPVVAILRQTTAPARIGDVDLPAGAVLYLHVGSANHDERVFDAPESFLPDRAGLSKHLAFGTVTHSCIGAPLARLQARLALERLLERVPSLRLADPTDPLQYVPNLLFPQVQQLRLSWDSQG